MINFIKNNAKILLIAVMISFVAVQQVNISRKQNILLRGQVILSNEQDDFQKDLLGACKIIAEEITISRKMNIAFAELIGTTVVEIYASVEKDPAKRKNLIDKIDKITIDTAYKPAKELTEAQKMGKKWGQDTVEMMKAMEEELRKGGYPY